MPSLDQTNCANDSAPAFTLLRLNYEYLISTCEDHRQKPASPSRLDAIEKEVITLFWRLSHPDRTQLAVQFRAFIAMRKAYRSRS